MNFKLTILVSIAAVVVSVPVSAQKTSIDAADRFGGVYHPYLPGVGETTHAPKGYKAFYISHMGRHGSRYPVERDYIMYGYGPLLKCDAEGILTAEGKMALRGYAKLDSVSNGVYGFLNQLGAEEHKGIAERMYDRFPEVFRQKDRDSIFVQSTHRQRCLKSSWIFCTTLAAKVSKIRIGIVSGEKYYAIISNAETPAISKQNKLYNKYSDKFALENFDFDTFFARLFTDPEKARGYVRSERTQLESMYTNGTVALQYGITELCESLTPEDYEFAARNYNAKMNCQHCVSAENGEFRKEFARPLLADFVDRADAAVAGNGLAADLRFTHDTGLMPFFGLIGLEGYEHLYTYEQAFENWDSTRLMCMGTNLQAIFYRNRRGDVLVKLMLNERETSIPSLGEGPYYNWAELRSYLLSL